MNTELKIRVDSLEQFKRLLLQQNAVFISKSQTRHVYFNQPKNFVVKLVYEKNRPTTYTELEKVGNRFVFQVREDIKDEQIRLNKLKRKFGIKHESNEI